MAFAKQRLLLRHWLTQVDPGLLHTRHASRTVLSVIITALLLQHASFTALFLACFASASVQQGLVGYRRDEIITSMLISSFAMLAYVCLILIVITPPWLSNLSIVAAAFLAFYVRRFGQRYNLFPIFVWLLGFVTTIFVKSFTWSLFIPMMIAISIGLIVAMIIRFWIIPDIRAQQFASTLHSFFMETRRTLVKINQQLKNIDRNYDLDSYLADLKIHLRQLFLQNETILTLSYGRNNICEQQLFFYINHQYNAGKALIMTVQSLIDLRKMPQTKHVGSTTFLKNLIQSNRHNLTYLCRSLHPVIQYKHNFSVTISLDAQLDMMKNIGVDIKNDYLHFDDLTIAVFKYQFSLQHLIHNLAAFGQAHE